MSALWTIAARIFPPNGKHRRATCIGCEQANNGLPRGTHCGRCWCC